MATQILIMGMIKQHTGQQLQQFLDHAITRAAQAGNENLKKELERLKSTLNEVPSNNLENLLNTWLRG